MTDDDEARQLADARAQREALNELPGRLDAVEDRLSSAEQALEHFAELVTEADIRTPFHWPDVPDDETRAELWAGLVEWIEKVIVPWHPAAAKMLAPCWWQHRTTVGLLTDAWVAWIGDYRSREAKHNAGVEWRNTALPLLTEGLKDTLSTCRNEREHRDDVPVGDMTATVPRGPELPSLLLG